MAISYKLDMNKSVLVRGVSSIKYDSAVRLGIVRGLSNPAANTTAAGSKWTAGNVGSNDMADAVNLIIAEQGYFHPVYTNLPLAYVRIKRFAAVKAFVEMEYRRYTITVPPGSLRANYRSTFVSVPWYRNNRTVDATYGFPTGEILGQDPGGADASDKTARPQYHMLSVPGLKISVPRALVADPIPTVFFAQGKINKTTVQFFTYTFAVRQLRYDGMNLNQIYNAVNDTTTYQVNYEFTALRMGFWSQQAYFGDGATGAFPSVPAVGGPKQWRTLNYLSHDEVIFPNFPTA